MYAKCYPSREDVNHFCSSKNPWSSRHCPLTCTHSFPLDPYSDVGSMSLVASRLPGHP